MRSFNQVIFVGRLTGDPEQRVTQQAGKTLTTFSLAVPRDWYGTKDKEVPTDFFRVVAWDKFAEFCGKVLKKGMTVLVSGPLLMRSYEGKNGKQIINEVSLRNLNILSWPKGKPVEENELPPQPEEIDPGCIEVIDGTMATHA